MFCCARFADTVPSFDGWKDSRIYRNGFCAACLVKGKQTKLPTRAKALNHWSADGSGKDKSATIRDCSFSSLPVWEGLADWAREQNSEKDRTRLKKLELER